MKVKKKAHRHSAEDRRNGERRTVSRRAHHRVNVGGSANDRRANERRQGSRKKK
jgi:hypothetical protein